MTVAELIEKLQKFPPNTRVVVCGFDESGYDDPGEPRKVSIVQIHDYPDAHYGKYRDEKWLNGERPIGAPFDAVLINF